MKGRIFTLLTALVVLALVVAAPWQPTAAQGRSGAQQMAQLRFASDGAQANGANALQVGEMSTLTAAVASATRTEVVAAPASGSSIYLRGIWIEKMTATTGTVTVTQGTGTNCATSPVVLLTIGPQTATSLIPVGYYAIGAQVPAAKALCLTTDAATTSARALAN